MRHFLLAIITLLPALGYAAGARSYAQSPVAIAVSGATSTTLPSFEDDGGTVLHWTEDRYNWIRFPETFSVVAWSGTGATFAPAPVSGPFGYGTAQLITADLAGGQHAIGQTVAIPANTVFHKSIFVKAGTGTVAVIYGTGGTSGATFDLVARTAVVFGANSRVADIRSVGNGWFRISVGYGAADMNYFVGLPTGAASNGQTLYVWGAEEGDGRAPLFPTPTTYFPAFAAGDDTFVLNGASPNTSLLTLSGFPWGFDSNRYVGPYTDLNHFTGPGGGASTAGTICVAFRLRQTPAANETLFATAAGNTEIRFGAAPPTMTSHFGATVPAAQGSPTAGTAHFTCIGGDGVNTFTQVDTSNSQTAAIGAGAGLLPEFIGRSTAAGRFFASGEVYEVWATTTAWVASTVSVILQRAVMNSGDGPFFLDDAGTVFHLRGTTYDGTTWRSPQFALTTVGSVASGDDPYSHPNVPRPARRYSRGRIGGSAAFSATNFMSEGVGGVDVLDALPVYSICTMTRLENLAVAPCVILSDGADATSGWWIDVGVGPGQGQFVTASGGGNVAVVGTGLVPLGINVVCVGRDSIGQGYFKANLAPTVIGATAPFTPDLADPIMIGRRGGAVPAACANASVAEVWASSTAPSDALFTTVQAKMLSQLTAEEVPLTVTRSTFERDLIPLGGASPAGLYDSAPNVASVTADGVQVWPAATNLALQSETLATAPWVATNVTIVTDANAFIDIFSANTMDRLTSSAVTGTVAQPVTVASTTGPFTVSAWARANAATAPGTVGMIFGTGAPTGCVCSVLAIDNTRLPCTVATTATAGYAYTTTASSGPTAALRLSLTCSSTLAFTSITPFVFPGQWQTSTGAVYFDAVQFEAGPGPTPYIPTATLSVLRDATTISTQNNLGRLDPFCVTGTYTPGAGYPWIDGTTLFSAGTFAAANSMIAQVAGGAIVLTVYDAAATPKTFTGAAHGFAAGTKHDLAIGYDAGVGRMAYDRVPVAVTPAGAGIPPTGSTQPFYLGFGNGAFWTGAIRNFQVYRAASCGGI